MSFKPSILAISTVIVCIALPLAGLFHTSNRIMVVIFYLFCAINLSRKNRDFKVNYAYTLALFTALVLGLLLDIDAIYSYSNADILVKHILSGALFGLKIFIGIIACNLIYRSLIKYEII